MCAQYYCKWNLMVRRLASFLCVCSYNERMHMACIEMVTLLFWLNKRILVLEKHFGVPWPRQRIRSKMLQHVNVASFSVRPSKSAVCTTVKMKVFSYGFLVICACVCESVWCLSDQALNKIEATAKHWIFGSTFSNRIASACHFSRKFI